MRPSVLLWGTCAIAAIAIGQTVALITPPAATATSTTPTTTIPTSQPATRPVDITISTETTFILGPVNPDGTINYVEAINQRLARGVTADNNAAVLLLDIMGPALFKEPHLTAIRKKLNLPAQPKDAPQLLTLDAYAKIVRPPDAEYDPYPRRSVGKQFDKAIQAPWAPWARKDLPIAADYLAKNDRALEVVAKAAARSRFFIPLHSKDSPAHMLACEVPHLGSMTDASRMLAARAMLRLSEDDVDGAVADVLTIHRLSRLVGQHPSLIAAIVALRLESVAADADVAIARSGRLSSRATMSYLKELSKLAPLAHPAAAVNEHYRFTSLDNVMMMARRTRFEMPPEMRGLPRPFDWDRVLRRINKILDDQVVIAEDEPSADAVAAQARLDTEKESLLQMRSEENTKRLAMRVGEAVSIGPHALAQAMQDMLTQTVGMQVVDFAFETVSRCATLEREALAKSALSQTALAIHAYRQDKKSLPEHLGQLVGDYLKDVPFDPFSGKPLIYKPTKTGYLLYSIGPNRKDDGGDDGMSPAATRSSQPAANRPDDLSVKME